MTQTLATTSSLRGRVARKSDDYAAAIIARREKAAPLSHEAKVKKMALILSDETSGIRRLGVGMVGPIQLKLRYQGITRNVLVEDPVTPGTPVEYDVWDDLGQAYIMSGTEGEVRVTPFEGKRVPVRFFRIASRPAIRKEDLFYLRINAVEQAQDETKQAILKQEDTRLLVLLQAALTDYATRPGPHGHPEPQHHGGVGLPDAGLALQRRRHDGHARASVGADSHQPVRLPGPLPLGHQPDRLGVQGQSRRG
jgi:hypothetical protein